MDIVSRLKLFMDEMNIANSQLADNSGIPRPTVSQIMNGRNKKISDELIGKIHIAYPNLSILWLMFGEGKMLVDSDNTTTKVQNVQELSFIDPQVSASHPLMDSTDLFSSVSKNRQENSVDNFKEGVDIERRTFEEFGISGVIANGAVSVNKRIKSIVVLYEDNTFQTFDPS